MSAGERPGRSVGLWIAAAGGIAVVAVVTAVALAVSGPSDGGGSPGAGGGGDTSTGKAEKGGSSGDGPTVAEVAAATRTVHTARFQGQSLTKGNRYSWSVTLGGGLDRRHDRAGILVSNTMRDSRASSEYRVFGRRVYLRQLTPRPGTWVRQNLRTQGPPGSLPYAVATGGILKIERLLADPLKKVSEGSVRGEHVTEYRAEVRGRSAGRVLNTATPRGELRIWLDSRDRVRRLRYGTGSPSSNPALGTIGEQASIDFYALNEPIRVSRPRVAEAAR